MKDRKSRLIWMFTVVVSFPCLNVALARLSSPDSILMSKYKSQILFFFGYRSFIRNKTRAVVINMAIKRMLENKVHLLDVSYKP